jgi:hypothetical protein
MSCHTQVPTASRTIKDFEKTDLLQKPFDKAEFLFSTRAFDQAKVIYEDLITHFPDNKVPPEQIETALERMITYFARIQRNPELGVKALEQYKTNDKLAPFLLADIAAWTKAFRQWKNEPTLDPATATDAQVLTFAKKNLDPKVSGFVMTADNPQAANYLKVSGILYEYLQNKPESAATPEILYWLAICDKGLNNNFFYSLGDIYLRECIVKYPSSAVAKDCYDEYESETILSYSGSGGTHLPDDVKRELAHLKALIISPPSAGGRN